ncbi:MAG: hypothetical protein ACTHJN_08905 [Ginsengibacter sp.]
MKHRDYSFLKNYFDWQTFPVNDNSSITRSAVEYIKNFYPDYRDREYKYACIFYEKSTNKIISCSPCDVPESYNKSFHFYLQQLPSLQLHDVAFFFNLVNEEDLFMEDMFQWPENYPSSFCKEFLKDTYGYVTYNYQFMHLVQFSYPEATSYPVMNDYRTKYNKRLPDIYKSLEKLYLPDGYNLGQLMKHYTIKSSYFDNYGFVTYPAHAIAYDFIACAQKHL